MLQHVRFEYLTELALFWVMILSYLWYDCGGGNHHGTDYNDGYHGWHGVMVVGLWQAEWYWWSWLCL